jgi:hypothetical protein
LKIIDNLERVDEVVCAITGDDLFHLFTELFSVGHIEHAQQWKVSPEH